MKLYHVSRSNCILDRFVPRQPQLSLSLNENKIAPDRVCVSSTLEGCFSAVYFGCSELKYSRWYNNLYDETPKERDNTELYPFILYVFETDNIDPLNIKLPSEVFSLGVKDAKITNEHWILQEIEPSEVFYLYVESFNHDLIPNAGINLYTITDIKCRLEKVK